MKYGREDLSEKAQMDRRILYKTGVKEEDRQEVTRHCGFCTARLFLEGRAALDAPAPAASDPPALPAAAAERAGSASSSEPARKKPRTASDCLQELKDLKALLDQDLLTPAECADLKAKILRGD